MTEVNGLRLAYRGLVTGLAAGYVWAAMAMLGAILAGADAILPFIVAGGGDGWHELLAGIAVAELGAGLTGMAFAYFFGRFFTVRGTLLVAAVCFALLGWLSLTALGMRLPGAGPQLALVAAALAYGIVLGLGVPLRGEVTRYPAGSPSTSPST